MNFKSSKQFLQLGMSLLITYAISTPAVAEKTRAQMFREMSNLDYNRPLVSKPTKISSKELAKAKRSLANQLVDPDSLQWGNTFIPMLVVEEKHVGGTKQLRILCGKANAKNKMGGYNGFSYWLAIDYEDGFEVSHFGKGTEVLCEHYGVLTK